MNPWPPDELERINVARELRIANRPTGRPSPAAVPIWAVCVGGQVYVRTWYRRTSGWFGGVVDSRRAHIDVPGLAADVAVEDLGEGTPRLRAAIDDAYRAKYGHSGGAESMITDTAAATTLRLEPPTA